MPTPMARVAIVLNDDFSMYHFFRGYISELVARGFMVFVVTPDGPYVARLKALGASHIPVRFERFVSPIADLHTLVRLKRAFSANRVNIVCNITVKPIVFGSIAARLARVRRIVGMVEGIGYVFEASGDWRRKLLRSAVSALYWIGFHLSDRVGFANEDDRAFFVDRRIVASGKAVAFRSMVGVDVDECSEEAVDQSAADLARESVDLEPGQLLITMVARAIWSKGVREFVEAAALVAARFPQVRFLLVGNLEPDSPEAVPQEYLQRHRGRSFRWIGFRTDLRELLHLSDVIVLPSYYREGVPRILLESLSMGKPIVTTDNVGCRETVEPGRNGFLVPPKNPEALADAVCKVVADAQLRRDFGRQSRLIAVRDFDQRVIISRVLSELLGLS